MNDFMKKFNRANPDGQVLDITDPDHPDYVDPDAEPDPEGIDPDPEPGTEPDPEPTLEDTVGTLAQGMQLIQEQMNVLMTGGGGGRQTPTPTPAPPEPKVVTFVQNEEEAAQLGLGEEVNVPALNALLNKVVTEAVSVGKEVIAPEILSTVQSQTRQDRLLDKFQKDTADLDDVRPFVDTMIQRYSQNYPDQNAQWILQNAEAYVRKATGRTKDDGKGGNGKAKPPKVPKSKGGGSYRGAKKESPMSRILKAHNKIQ